MNKKLLTLLLLSSFYFSNYVYATEDILPAQTYDNDSFQLIDHLSVIEAGSGSMSDTIQTGDLIFYNEFAYIPNKKIPERKDIVVFKYPVDKVLMKNTYYIGRIVGLPGEIVEIIDGELYINGSETPMDEDYIKEEWTVKNDGFTFEIPEDSYLMLGDNRNNSNDSRYWAEKALQYGAASTSEEAASFSYVSINDIIGKIEYVYRY